MVTSASEAEVIAALMPERVTVVDESNTSGVLLPQATAGAPAHDWPNLTGGAIGYGIPAPVGAAVAGLEDMTVPARRVTTVEEFAMSCERPSPNQGPPHRRRRPVNNAPARAAD